MRKISRNEKMLKRHKITGSTTGSTLFRFDVYEWKRECRFRDTGLRRARICKMENNEKREYSRFSLVPPCVRNDTALVQATDRRKVHTEARVRQRGMLDYELLA